MFTAWLYQLGDTGGLRGGPAAGGELACGQSALQLFVRELLRPAGLLDVDVAVGRLSLLVEHGELAGQGPDDGMEAVEDGGVVEAAHFREVPLERCWVSTILLEPCRLQREVPR